MGSKLLTGWAIAPQYHKALHADLILDSTSFVSTIIDENGSLTGDWPEKLIQFIEKDDRPESLTGFSMGAILALKYAQLKPVKNLTLIAPTFSFVARKSFPFGIKEKLLNSMIASLTSFPDQTVSKFLSNCGVTHTLEMTYTNEVLLKGLLFLKAVELPTTPLFDNTNCEILHSSEDRIISCKAGNQVAEAYNCSITEISGGHAALLKLT